jgi:hypothetical protein
MTPKIRKYALIAALLSVAAVFVGFGILCYPGMHADGDMFLPATMNVGACRGWVVEGYVPMLMGRNGSELYNNHGFLMPLIFGALLHGSSMQRIYLLCGVTNAAAVLLYGCIALGQPSRLSWFRSLFAFLLAVAAGVIGLALQGRPEQLALLILPWPYLLWQTGSKQTLFYGASILAIAALSALSPLLGLYYWIGHSVLLVRVAGGRLLPHLRLQAITILGALAIFSAAIALFTPFNLAILLDQILNYSKSPYIQGYQLLAIGNLHLQTPLWQLPLMAVLLAGIAYLYQQRQLLLAIILATPLAYLAKLSGSYLYLPFVPLCLLLIRDQTEKKTSNLKALFKLALAIFLSLYLLIFLRYVALEGLYLSSSTRYESVKSEIEALQRLAALSDGVVAYSKARFPSFSVFGDPGNELIAVRASTGDDSRKYFETLRQIRVQFIVLVQEGQMEPSPPQYLDNKKFILSANHWSATKPKPLGIKIGGYNPGYSYAVYKLNQ